MAKVRLSVGVRDSHLKQMSKIAKAAQKAGMKIERQLKDVGVLTGSIDADKVKHLHRIEGVSHVEEERSIALPPSGSPVQ